MKIKRRARHHNAIPTASMADIAMLLLIFFLSTTIFKAREALSVRLPGATTERTRRRSGVAWSFVRTAPPRDSIGSTTPSSVTD